MAKQAAAPIPIIGHGIEHLRLLQAAVACSSPSDLGSHGLSCMVLKRRTSPLDPRLLLSGESSSSNVYHGRCDGHRNLERYTQGRCR